MPLFTVTMKSSRSANEKDCLSRAIHAASVIAAELPGKSKSLPALPSSVSAVSAAKKLSSSTMKVLNNSISSRLDTLCE